MGTVYTIWESDLNLNLIKWRIMFCTRMHSSRMRTGRWLTVCRSLLPGLGCRTQTWGVLYYAGFAPLGVKSWDSVCSLIEMYVIPGTEIWSRGCLLRTGACSRGVPAKMGGVRYQGAGCICSGKGVCSRGWYPSIH